jgi:competence protein ComEC
MSASDPPGAVAARLDLRLVPAAVAAWAGMWLVIAWPAGLAAVAGAGLLTGLAAWRRQSAAAALVATVLAVTALAGGGRVALMTRGPVPELAEDRAVATVELRIDSVTLVGTRPTVLVRATLTALTARGQSYRTNLGVLVFADPAGDPGWAGLTPGDRVSVTARLGAAERTDQAAAVLDPLTAPSVTDASSGWRRAVESVRAGLRQAVAGARPEQAALLPALVVGDTSTMPAALKADFKTTGLTHLTAVSGANLTILLAFLLGAARWVGVRGRALNVIAVLGVAGFVLLCHSEPSVLRAGAMGLVGLAALAHSARPGRGLRHLALAVILLVWIDPWLAHSIGFTLSALACAGLLIWAGPWTERLARWLPRWAAEAVTVPLAAQLATQPLVSYLSGTVSLSGLAANAAAGPFVAPATVAGLVTALAAALHPGLGALAGRAAAWTVEPILQIAHRAADLPGAAHPWPVTPAGLAGLGLACLLVAWLVPRLFDHRYLSLAAALVLTVALLRPPFQPGWPPDGWAVAACDVGQGDALAVRVADGQALLLDTGPPDAGLTQCLATLGVDRVALVVLSHLHSDHTGGLAEVLDGFAVGAVLAGPADAGDPALDVARQLNIDIHTAVAGERFSVGAATVEVIAAPEAAAGAADDAEESSAENDASLVVRVSVAGVSVLATGDLETEGQRAVLAAAPDLRADILKVPHHGSARQLEAFLAAAGATIALVSVGQDNGYGHPAASTLATLAKLGLAVVRTDEHGAIAVARDEAGELTVTVSG